jgi:phage terminase large subunit GpA-like protein
MNSLVLEVLNKNSLSCPECGENQRVDMLDADYSFAYQCNSCNSIIEKKENSCCVYCSYGEVKCPTQQIKWN